MTDARTPPSPQPVSRSWAKVKEDRHGEHAIALYERRQNGRFVFMAKVMIHRNDRTRTTMVVTGARMQDVEKTIREHYVFYRMGRLKVMRG